MSKSCDEPSKEETRKLLRVLDKRLKIYIALAVIYGLVFINFIDLAYSGPGYHAWLIMMYFFPFFALSATSLRRNWRLTLALGLIASLMNDVFYFPMGLLFGKPFDLIYYYNLWLVPQGAQIFSLNLGFATVAVYSWTMALTIYVRIFLVIVMLRAWKIRAQEKCVNGKLVLKKTRFKFWDKFIERT